MSIKQPFVTVGLPHVTVVVKPTGDPEIDAGLEAFLLQQSGVGSVSQRRVGDQEVSYNIGLAVKPQGGVVMVDVASAIKTYYVSYGMTPEIRFVNDL